MRYTKSRKELVRLECVIFNFYGLYFANREIFCKKSTKIKSIKSSKIKSEAESEKSRPNSVSKKKKSFWDKIKSFFTGKKLTEQAEEVVEPLKAFIEQSKFNQLKDQNEEVVFEYPGLNEAEVEKFLMIYYTGREHVCEHCVEEKKLIVRILQKDIVAKIHYSADLTRNSVKAISSKHLGLQFFERAYRAQAVTGKKNPKLLNEGSTQANTKLPMSPSAGNQVGAFNTNNFSESEGTPNWDKSLQRAKAVMNKFSEYDFECQRKSTKLRGNFHKKRGSNLFSMKSEKTVTNLADFSSKPRNATGLQNFDYFGEEEASPDKSKLRRMSRRRKSKMSNYFKSDKSLDSSTKMKTLGSSVRSFMQEDDAARRLGRGDQKNALAESWAVQSGIRQISVPKSRISAGLKLFSMTSISNPATKTLKGITASKIIGKMTSLRNVDSKKEFLGAREKTNQGTFGDNGGDARFKKKRANSVMQPGLDAMRQAEKSPWTGKRDIFHISGMDGINAKSMKKVDFSKLNSFPRR